MHWFLDTEFLEDGAAGRGSIALISIGLVSTTGAEYYAENAGFQWGDVPDDHWLHENVKPHLLGGEAARFPSQIKDDILSVVGSKPDFWGWYCDYDWVVFCWLFGRMVDLPSHFPMFCRDLRQSAKDKHFDTSKLPKQDDAEHNALNDARWNKRVWEVLRAA